jgi:hypothetical protein
MDFVDKARALNHCVYCCVYCCIWRFDSSSQSLCMCANSHTLHSQHSPETWTEFEEQYKRMSNGYHLAAGLAQADNESDEQYFKKHGGLRVVVLTSPPWGVFKDDEHDVRLNSAEIKVGNSPCLSPCSFHART